MDNVIKVLASVNRGIQKKIEDASDLPKVSEADEGKFLRVSNGVWSAEIVQKAEEASF